VYLNGTEVARNYMISGAVSYNTFAGPSGAGPAVSDDGAATFSTNINLGLLVNGTNVIAVEIHQADLTSSDIWFVMDFLGVPTIIRNQFPLVQLTAPTNGDFFLGPASITLSATASDPDGTVAKVEFFVDGAKLGESTADPYS